MATADEGQLVPCPLCTSGKGALLMPVEDKALMQCSECHVIFTFPPPVGNLYEDETYFEGTNRYIERIDEFATIFGRLLVQVEKHKPIGRLLDVGCGPGILLHVARSRGWTVEGVDISPWAVEYAARELHLPVKCGELTQLQFPPNTFDVIIVNHAS